MTQPPPEANRASGRRAAVVLDFVGAAVVVLAATRTWATVSVTGLPGMSELVVSGRQAAPAGIPIALAAAAGAFVLVTAGRAIRTLVALALLVFGCYVGVNSIQATHDAAGLLARALRTSIGLFSSRSDLGAQVFGGSFTDTVTALTPWPWVAVAGGALIALSGLVALVRGRTWPDPANRFERASVPAATRREDDAAGTWDALSRGDDPT